MRGSGPTPAGKHRNKGSDGRGAAVCWGERDRETYALRSIACVSPNCIHPANLASEFLWPSPMLEISLGFPLMISTPEFASVSKALSIQDLLSRSILVVHRERLDSPARAAIIHDSDLV
ncbi:hypothetical protein L1987_10356 [Smallanthus sonchifolius]|uniref:Uncharacterized protein n=1 Tax=Smallanthus sonchifolius TaxID=185202 RepID=A0ACB9JRY0_9ASTR|nr:hypothetical protein L1987_10356 [Smallanthus sonchifolius]